MIPSATHLVLIPSYNTGPRLSETVAAAQRHWAPVWVVIDGSTDGSGAALADGPGFRVLRLTRNRGKGAAILHGLREAAAAGFTHVLTLDADGQHEAADIPRMMELSRAEPGAMVLGEPVFDASAPWERIAGRRIANALTRALAPGIGDALFGLRVYPITPLLEAFAATRWMRRFDFEPEAAIRLRWRGIRPRNLPSQVRYFRPEEGGVSHFRYLRDNLLLGFMFARLGMGRLRSSRHSPRSPGR
ncbi:MAG TPA: glycosyltransferase family 2 protein [Acetobacteraceae bacterium]